MRSRSPLRPWPWHGLRTFCSGAYCTRCALERRPDGGRTRSVVVCVAAGIRPRRYSGDALFSTCSAASVSRGRDLADEGVARQRRQLHHPRRHIAARTLVDNNSRSTPRSAVRVSRDIRSAGYAEIGVLPRKRNRKRCIYNMMYI